MCLVPIEPRCLDYSLKPVEICKDFKRFIKLFDGSLKTQPKEAYDPNGIDSFLSVRLPCITSRPVL